MSPYSNGNTFVATVDRPITILVILGTRPEAIKMAPLVFELKKSQSFSVQVCSTGQHIEMLDQVLQFFELEPDYKLGVMKFSQGLPQLTSVLLEKIHDIIESTNPHLVLVQGDTTSAMVGALCAFYHKIPIGHIEAGLRSQDKYSPFPEEINRLFISCVADYHFAPTERARDNLLKEGRSPERIAVVGNTVIDALLWGQRKVANFQLADFAPSLGTGIGHASRMILVTGHRRENFGEPLRNICYALKEIANQSDVEIVYPVHLNPSVRGPVKSILSDCSNIHLIDPVSYPGMIYLLTKAYIVLTDSGGIQEEAPSLGKPVLVMRSTTERTEGIDCGITKLIGTDKSRIVIETLRLLSDHTEYARMSSGINPYGDGKASQKIRSFLEKLSWDSKEL